MDYFEVITDAKTGAQTTRPYTPEEVAAADAEAYTVALVNVRAARNALLAACDWTQLPDAQADQTAWAAYRQALRDVPQQPGFPLSVVWPVQP